jgi:hypothetical protein
VRLPAGTTPSRQYLPVDMSRPNFRLAKPEMTRRLRFGIMWAVQLVFSHQKKGSVE